MSKLNVTRRNVVGAGGVGALALTTGMARAAGQSSRKPNIIYIMADDLGYADVSCYGRPDFDTPQIDALARSGMRLMQAYANSAVCSSTRTALITGRYQYRLPIGLEEPLAGERSPHVGLPPDHPTLPSLLRKAGYGTALVGKWHLGELPDYGPLKSGYDHFWGFRGGALDYFSHRGTGNSEDLWDDDNPIHPAGYLTELLGAQASKVIEHYAKEARPFFLSLHFNAPHWPWEGPEDEGESKRISGTPLRAFDAGSQKTYAQMVQAMDREVGRVLATIDRLGLGSNTIVVFTSDNGGERFADTWPFSGQKTELLEGGIRVPAIIRWPGVTAPSSVSQQVAITMDWVPTLLAAAGTAPDAAFPSDGMDLTPYLRGASAKARKLYWRYKANRQRAMRDGDFKYLRILDNSFLFNVVDDPLERANLKDRQKDVFLRLETEWKAWNAQMLPEIDASFTEGVTGKVQADHIGAQPSDRKADPGN